MEARSRQISVTSGPSRGYIARSCLKQRIDSGQPCSFICTNISILKGGRESSWDAVLRGRRKGREKRGEGLSAERGDGVGKVNGSEELE